METDVFVFGIALFLLADPGYPSGWERKDGRATFIAQPGSCCLITKHDHQTANILPWELGRKVPCKQPVKNSS